MKYELSNPVAVTEEVISIKEYVDAIGQEITGFYIYIPSSYKGLIFKNLGPRRYKNNEVVFAISLSTHEYKGKRRAHIVAIPSDEVKNYDLLLSYHSGTDKCHIEISQFTRPLT